MNKVFIVAAKRSPIGMFLGALKDMPLADFATQVLKQTLVAGNVPATEVDTVIVGNVFAGRTRSKHRASNFHQSRHSPKRPRQ
ncbi:MAG: hypothetical protein MZU97_24200 [Bacillus subtilis]|nr:hypothetical protein [Bacillus subtilis]